MKKIHVGVLCFIAGCLLSGIITKLSLEKENDETLTEAREAAVQLNVIHNKMYQTVAVQAMSGKKEFELTAYCLQNLTKPTIKMDKALKLDCRQYENGKPVIIEGEELEILPEIVKIME